METGKVYLDERPNGGIIIGNRLRGVDQEKVDVLAQSMAMIGLQTPISVWSPNDQEVHLVAGAHRLAAAIKLGWESIDCSYVTLSEIDRRRWEIAENLHRSELTVLQRDEHVAEWIKLTEETEEEQKVAQLAPLKKPGAGRGSKGGIREASRELGIDRDDARRAVKVAGLSDEAKEVAREVHLDDNRSALLLAASEPKERQADTLREIAARKEAPPRTDVPKRNDLAYETLICAWDAAPDEVRWAFLRAIPSKYQGGIAV